jgi:hemin uptake protein HemP
MPTPLRIESGELTAAEIIDAVREGRRVVVEAELLGGTHEVALRHDGEVYYCDTPTTLHKHADAEAMIGCIERMGYAREE